MKAKRKRHDAQFKARVALEALKGVKTVQEIAKEFDVHPVQVSDWKKKLSTLASSVFESGTVHALESGVERWMKQYNTWRPHETLANKTPREVYRPQPKANQKIQALQQAA